jgi:hypothetical protein
VRRTMLMAALLAAAVAPGSFAASPPSTNNPTAGGGCLKKTVLLIGTLTSNPQFVGAGTFTMRTTAANKYGQNFIGGADETISVGVKTRVGRLGGPNLIAAFGVGDPVFVSVRVCKADLPLTEATLRATPAAKVTNAATSAP